jgi:hypothetical protein
MKRWLFPVALVLLNGCSSTIDLKSPDVPVVAGTLALDWIAPHSIELQLDGLRYAGDWTSSVCTTDACRGIFRNVLKIHRRHIHQGRAVLTAQNGARLDCEWVSHLPELDGTCRAPDGRLFSLKSDKSTAPGLNADLAIP